MVFVLLRVVIFRPERRLREGGDHFSEGGSKRESCGIAQRFELGGIVVWLVPLDTFPELLITK